MNDVMGLLSQDLKFDLGVHYLEIPTLQKKVTWRGGEVTVGGQGYEVRGVVTFSVLDQRRRSRGA